MSKYVILILILIISCTLFGSGVLSLEEAKALLLENNPEYKAKESALKAAEWEMYQGLSALFPTARLQSGYTFLDPKPPGTGQEDYAVSYGLTFNQPIFMGGKLWLAYRMRRDAVRIAKADLDNTRLTLLSKLEEAYYDCLLAEEFYEINRNSLRLAEHNLVIAQARLDAGTLSRAGFLQMKSELSSKEVALLQAENVLYLTYRQLQNLIKTDNFQLAEIDIDNYQQLLSLYQEIDGGRRDRYREKLVGHGLIHNPLLIISRAAKDISRKALNISKGNFLPTINLSGTYSWSDRFGGMENFHQETTFILSASIPIFPLIDNFAGYRSNYHSYRRTESETEVTEDRIKLGIEAAFFTSITSAGSITSAELALQYAEETYSMMEERFRNGLISSADLISIELLLTTAGLNAARSKYDFLKGRSALMNLLNVETDEELIKIMTE